MKSCVTIEYFDYPDTADVCYTDVGKRISPSDGSSIPCAQFAVSPVIVLHINAGAEFMGVCGCDTLTTQSLQNTLKIRTAINI